MKRLKSGFDDFEEPLQILDRNKTVGKLRGNSFHFPKGNNQVRINYQENRTAPFPMFFYITSNNGINL